MFTITVAGHVCADFTPELPLGIGMTPGHLYDVGPLAIQPGGCIVNVGRALHALGIQSRSSGIVGADELGGTVIRAMSDMGLDTSDIQRTDEIGTSYTIVIEPAGMNRSFWHHTGANNTFHGAQVNLDDTDLLHLGYPSLAPGLLPNNAEPLVTVMQRAKQAGITTSLDLAVVDQTAPIGQLDWHSMIARTLVEVDVFSPSIDDLTSALEIGPVSSKEELMSIADDMIEAGAAIVMLSAGEDGLLVRSAGAERLAQGGRVLQALGDEWANATAWAPAREISRVVTTNGAGDSASAGLLYGLIHGYSPEKTAEQATRVAAGWIQGELLTSAG
ncbi:MAG: carbohydrate kinase family protein [Leucobacter sp.]